MKKITKLLIGCITALLAVSYSDTVKAQEYVPTPVTVSEEKVKVGDETFYSHVVLEKQTLYSIAKAYKVSVEEIYKYNPEVEISGLQKNSILRIPIMTKLEEIAEEEVQEDVDVTEEPDGETKEQPEVRIHVVRWYEDIYSIAENYGVTVQEIMSANNLKNEKLKTRQEIIIPVGSQPAQEEEAETEAKTHQTDTSIHINLSDSTMTPVATENARNEVTVTYLLPLNADGTSSNRGNMDFYCGSLMAINDIAENEGINITVNVYDIGNDVANGKINASVEELEASDLIIGPISPEDISKLYEYAPGVGPVVSPLDTKAESLIKEHKTLIQAPASHVMQYRDIAEWVKEDMQPEDKVIIIYNADVEKEKAPREAIDVLKPILDSAGIAFLPYESSIEKGRGLYGAIAKDLVKGKGTNRIIIASEHNIFVGEVLRNLYILAERNYNIAAYGPSKITTSPTLDITHLHGVSYHSSSRFYVDYGSDEVKDFLTVYRAKYVTEPSQFAFHGYDVTRYFIMNCARYRTLWPYMIMNNNLSMLQSDFYFTRENYEEGFINEGIRRAIYEPDFTVTPVL